LRASEAGAKELRNKESRTMQLHKRKDPQRAGILKQLRDASQLQVSKPLDIRMLITERLLLHGLPQQWKEE